MFTLQWKSVPVLSLCVATAFPLYSPLLWRAHFVSSLSIQAVCHFVSPLPPISDLSSFPLPLRYPNFLSMPFFTIIALRPVFILFILPHLSRLFLKFLLTEFYFVPFHTNFSVNPGYTPSAPRPNTFNGLFRSSPLITETQLRRQLQPTSNILTLYTFI